MTEQTSTPPVATPPTHQVPPEPKVKPAHHISIWRIFIGLLVILLGLQLLAQQYGWDWSVAIDWARIWPAFIIVAGLSLLVRPRGRWAWVIPMLAVILVVGVIAVPAVSPTPANQTYERTVSVDQTAGAKRAAVNLKIGAMKLDIGGGSTQLISGHFSSTMTDLTTASALDGDTQNVTLKNETTGRVFWFGAHRQTLDLQLANNMPTKLDIDAGASSSTIDLKDTLVDDLNIDSGAGALDLTLGSLVEAATVDVSMGASSLNISLPRDLGVKLSIDAGLSSKTLPEFTTLNSEHGLYESANYATATKKVTINIDAGASSIIFSWR